MSHQRSVALLVPVLNEIDGLKQILPRIKQEIFDEVLFVDGGSDDGTVEFLVANKCRTLSQTSPGLSEAILEGIANLKSDCVVEFSPDGNCVPELLPDLVKLLKSGEDLVVVSRYLPPAKSADDNFITSVGNFAFTTIINWFGKDKITDSLGIYRGFVINKFICDDLLFFLQGPVFEPLISIWALKNKYRVTEIPGDEPERIGGEKKMRILYNGYCILRMIVRVAFR